MPSTLTAPTVSAAPPTISSKSAGKRRQSHSEAPKPKKSKSKSIQPKPDEAPVTDTDVDEDDDEDEDDDAASSSRGASSSASGGHAAPSAKDLKKLRHSSGHRFHKVAAESAFRLEYPLLQVPIPPALLHAPQEASKELMDTLLMRYVPPLQGVLVAHENHTLMETSGRVDADSAFATVAVGMTCAVWAPRIGQRLEGVITLSTPSHVSLLVHGIFNASISAAHIPSHESSFQPRDGRATASSSAASSSKHGKDKSWEFVHHDEEPQQTGANKAEGDVDAEMEQGAGAESRGTNGLEEERRSEGYWQSKSEKKRLGGEQGRLTFTVIGITIANNMISLDGSLLSEPFSIPAPSPSSGPSSALRASYLSGGASLSIANASGNGGAASKASALASGPTRHVRFHGLDADEADDDEDDHVATVAASTKRLPVLAPSGKDKDKSSKASKSRKEERFTSKATDDEGPDEESSGKKSKKRKAGRVSEDAGQSEGESQGEGNGVSKKVKRER